MSEFSIAEAEVGILGGGQLGKMLCNAASILDIKTIVLDPTIDCPAQSVCSTFVNGSFNDYDAVCDFGKSLNLLTIEIEHVNSQALEKLEESGVEVRPSSKILKIIQDKGLQKKFFVENNLPTSKFKILSNKSEVLELIESNNLDLPFVQKACKFGYDGRGVQIVSSNDDIDNLIDGESVIEDLVEIEKELSVIVARNKLEDIKCFDPVEMVFNSSANLVDYLICPANISPDISQRAIELAIETIKSFNLYGILAVEMFLNTDGNLLINEVAPRPHNSGHHTIESCLISQYEQHLRSIFDLTLGETDIISPSVMVNLVGEPALKVRQNIRV